LNKDYKAKTNAELMKLNAPYDEAYKTKKGKKVLVNIFADENDKLKNIESAIVIVDQLDVPVVYIRPHVNVQKHKNQYIINEKLADRKEITSITGVKSAIESAKNQNTEVIVFDMIKFKDWEIKDFTRSIKGKLNSYKNKNWLKNIIVVNDSKAVEFTPTELNNNFEYVYKLLESTKSKR